MESNLSESADAVVVGGGPAGCTTAILLKRYNPAAHIVVLEKDAFPRHHVGESTLPDANAVLHKIGVIDALNRAGFPIKCGLTYKWRHDRPMFTDLFSTGVHPNLQERTYPRGLPDHSWQVERGMYDEILLRRAREVGVDVREQAQVVGALFDAADPERLAGVRYESGDQPARAIRARHVVDASGQARALSRWLRLGVEKFPLGDTALYRYYEDFRWNEELIGSFFAGKIFFASVPRGWMWFIPIGERTASVGLVTRKSFLSGGTPAQAFDEELAHAPEITDMLGGAVQVSHAYTDEAAQTYVVQDWTYRNERLAGPGWYLVGDAAAFVDPILSSGLNLAHNCALLVANAINTEWNHPDVPADAVRQGYQGLYREIYSSFLSMATWWYERRDTNISDWWKEAAKQARNPSSVVNLSDREVFLAFTAGYVTDFRFFNIGAGGFGAQGLNYIFDNLPDQPIEEKLHRPDMDSDSPLLPRFERYELGAYYGSHVGTNRWWRLPSLTFESGGRSVPFYPSILESEENDEQLLVDLSERIVLCTLAHIDGKRSANQVARALQQDFGGFDQRVHRSAMKFMHNLMTVKLLEPNPRSVADSR
jgi:clorobiocin biosynthesis protein Clo-hal